MPNTNCLICNKNIYTKPFHAAKGWGKYCSTNCRNKSQLQGKLFPCTVCQKLIYRSPKEIKKSHSGHYFCSKSCQTIWRNKVYSGENHPAWKSGITTYRSKLNTNSYPICRICGINESQILNAHHLDRNRHNNQLTNLTWLCLNCHYLVHHDKSIEHLLAKALFIQQVLTP